MPSANYLWPQLLNKWTRNSIEENGGEVVLEEYFPLDQMEYSATIGKIKKEKVDHVFNTIIPPGLSGFTKQLYESGFQSNGGSQSCVYWDENTPFYVAPEELEGAYSCLDFFHNVNDAYGQKLLKDYSAKWKDTQYQFTAGSAATGMYRAIRLYEQAVITTNGDLKREAVSSALEKVSLADGPGGGYNVVPGTGHISMNMYIAQAQKGKWNILSETKSVPPNECA